MIKRSWKFISNKGNRTVLSWVGAGLVVVVPAAWAAYLHFATPPSRPDRPAVSAENGIAAGDDISIVGPVHIGDVEGITGEQLPEIIRAASATQQDAIGRLEKRASDLGVSVERVLALARRISADVPDFDHAFAELQRAVDVAVEVERRGAEALTGDAYVDAVLARVAELSKAGKDDSASAEVNRALAEIDAQARQQKLALLDAGIDADILRRDPASVARRIEQKLEIDSDPAALFAALRTEQDDWYVRGRDKGLNFDLEVSIELARLALARASDAGERGAALLYFGVALLTLGERESGTARLEESVAAYRAALEERTRERVPLDWAMTQMNLGNALLRLGERETGTARLEEAAAAYRAALEERTREHVPLDWAMTQMNLGNALLRLGERETGTARLEEAVAAFRAALEETTRERVPLDWARTQMNLGTALWTLGERESGTGRLEEAVAAYRAALEERTRERVPLDWARTQMNLGTALSTLGERGSGTARLEEAVAAYGAALEETTREREPLEWASTTGNQATALLVVAERTSNSGMAREALAQLSEAEAVLRAGGHAPGADTFAWQIPEAEALVARLSR